MLKHHGAQIPEPGVASYKRIHSVVPSGQVTLQFCATRATDPQARPAHRSSVTSAPPRLAIVARGSPPRGRAQGARQGRPQYGLCEPLPCRGLPRSLQLGLHGTVVQLNRLGRGELPEGRRRTRNAPREQPARDDEPLVWGSSLRLGLHSRGERTSSRGTVSTDQLPIAGTRSNTREIQIRENPQRLTIDRELG